MTRYTAWLNREWVRRLGASLPMRMFLFSFLFSAKCTSARRNEHHSVLLSKNEERD